MRRGGEIGRKEVRRGGRLEEGRGVRRERNEKLGTEIGRREGDEKLGTEIGRREGMRS